VRPGEIHFHRHFYVDRETGAFRGKYLLALATIPGGDLVVRLLTSRPHGRPETPPCYHGDPYPGFHLGSLGAKLNRPTWVDLRGLEDFDPHLTDRERRHGNLAIVMLLDNTKLRAVLECVAAANDTTRVQERAIRDQLAAL
jgi:hypothetical protein